MLTEREYRITCIKSRYPALKGRKIVIYGSGINAKLIIDHAGSMIDIVGLMDENQTGRIIYGYKILSREEVASLQADTLIIAAQIDSAIAVYNRINSFCKAHGLEVYDLYGNQIDNLLLTIKERNTESNGKATDLIRSVKTKQIVDSADVISFDLKVLFDFSMNESELFQHVWTNRFHHGIKAFVNLRQRIGEQQEKSYGDLDSIYGMLKSYLCLSEEDKNDLLKTELILRRQIIKIENEMVELIRYGQDHGKKLYFINESILPGKFWIDVLNDSQIKEDSYVLLNHSESGHNKYNGLYREILEFEPDKKHLHIGYNYDADGIAASVYGFQSIVIRKTSDTQRGDDTHTPEKHLSINHIREYCTDRIHYTIPNSQYDGFVTLNVEDKYCIFIRQNAEIKPGWLEQLVSTAKDNEDASIVCSRITKEDGTVIYAGELVNEEPVVQHTQMVSGYLPVYDYVRYTEQICSVSFLVKKDRWEEAEKTAIGLREVFRVYVETTGKSKAIYQPLSEVTYKQSDLETLLLTADIKIPDRPKILVTDNLLTQFDHDAGSRCTWFYLKLFHKLGFDVTLMAQNFNEIQPYVTLIQQAGIRVIYGNYYRANWKIWLKNENDSFRYVYMQRPESTTFFLEEIQKSCRHAKIIYFAHDLHFLRLYREYEITRNPIVLQDSEKSKEQEYALIEAADVVHVVGTFEQEYLQRMYPAKKIRNIPLYIYDQSPEEINTSYNPAERRDLLYVGSFGHPPNLDAVVWFAEQILPSVTKKYPEIVWHVVGTNPPVSVLRYQGKNLILHGFLSDEELKKLYITSRIVVVPLRYGAGVKGKILEAAYYQVPIVTTPIGAEGIQQDEDNMIVCNTAEEFADAICSLYMDEERLRSMSEGGRRLIGKHYTETAAIEALKKDMLELQL